MTMYRKLLLAAGAALSIGLVAPAFAGDRDRDRGHGYGRWEYRHDGDRHRYDNRHGWRGDHVERHRWKGHRHGRYIERRPVVVHRHYYPVRPAPVYVEPGIEYRYPASRRPHVIVTVPPFVLDF